MQHYKITLYYFNPNIRPYEEYRKRAAEFEKLLAVPGYYDNVELIICGYSDAFEGIAAKFPEEPEGGERCRACFELRLAESAAYAKSGGYDCFATTLSVSPHKNAALLNAIGEKLSGKHGVKYLHSDFKKRDGYKRSVELSNHYGLYRQKYCGCQP